MTLNAAKILEAFAFAAEQHKYQRRAGFEPLPYINHLIKVTDAVVRIGLEDETEVVIAAILHDVVEDTEVTIGELSAKFGRKPAAIVEELTDDMSLPYEVRKQLQVETANQLSLPARKIRIADKVSNLEDIFGYELDWPISKKIAYLENSMAVVEQLRGASQALENWFDEVVGSIKKDLK